MIHSKNWWLITLKGLIFIFLGIYIFKFPVSGMLGLIFYGGISLIVSGIITASFAISTHKIHREWIWQLAEGLLDIIIGIILLSKIGLTAITLPFVFAFYGILTGVFWIIQGIFFRLKRYKFWSVAIIAGLFSTAIGVLIFVRPVIALFTIMGIIASLFLIMGIFLLLFSIEIRKAKKIFSGH